MSYFGAMTKESLNLPEKKAAAKKIKGQKGQKTKGKNVQKLLNDKAKPSKKKKTEMLVSKVK